MAGCECAQLQGLVTAATTRRISPAKLQPCVVAAPMAEPLSQYSYPCFQCVLITSQDNMLCESVATPYTSRCSRDLRGIQLLALLPLGITGARSINVPVDGAEILVTQALCVDPAVNGSRSSTGHGLNRPVPVRGMMSRKRTHATTCH